MSMLPDTVRQAARGRRQQRGPKCCWRQRFGTVLLTINDDVHDMPYLRLEDLDAWKVGMDLAEDVYRSTSGFPREEHYGLRLQVRRAAVSIVSNIAEGHGRVGAADNARYVLMARGSLKETETQIHLSRRLAFLDAAAADRLLALCDRLSRLLFRLHRSLKRRSA